MCCWNKDTLKLLGWIFMGAFTAGAIICIILAGIHFRFTSQPWTAESFYSLGAVELAAIIYVFVLGVVGVFGFIFESLVLLIIFTIITSISALFTFAIAIFALVGGSIKYWDEHIGCNSNYQGIISTWDAIDTYLIEVDTTMGSNECYLWFDAGSSLPYVQNTSIVPYYNQWWKTMNYSMGVQNFQQCNSGARNRTLGRYVNNNAYSNYTLNQDLFSEYYGHIENWFNCTGFCATTYYSEKTNTNMKMAKYLFSDTHRGVPTYIGCLHPILNWLPPTLNAFGSIALFVASFEGFVVYLAIALMSKHDEKEEHHNHVKTETERQHHEKSNREVEMTHTNREQQYREQHPQHHHEGEKAGITVNAQVNIPQQM